MSYSDLACVILEKATDGIQSNCKKDLDKLETTQEWMKSDGYELWIGLGYVTTREDWNNWVDHRCPKDGPFSLKMS